MPCLITTSSDASVKESRECETLRASLECRFDPLNGVKNLKSVRGLP